LVDVVQSKKRTPTLPKVVMKGIRSRLLISMIAVLNLSVMPGCKMKNQSELESQKAEIRFHNEKGVPDSYAPWS